MSWINHLPPACWSTFWKSNSKQQLGCRFDIMDNESYCFWCFDICNYICLDTSDHFAAVPSEIFFIFSSTLVLTSSYRRSLYAFYWISCHVNSGCWKSCDRNRKSLDRKSKMATGTGIPSSSHSIKSPNKTTNRILYLDKMQAWVEFVEDMRKHWSVMHEIVLIWFEHGYRMLTLSSRCDVLSNVINMKILFLG